MILINKFKIMFLCNFAGLILSQPILFAAHGPVAYPIAAALSPLSYPSRSPLACFNLSILALYKIYPMSIQFCNDMVWIRSAKPTSLPK